MLSAAPSTPSPYRKARKRPNNDDHDADLVTSKGAATSTNLTNVDTLEAAEQQTYAFITIFEANGLPSMDENGYSDPYVVVEFSGSNAAKSSVCFRSRDPKWHETFFFPFNPHTAVKAGHDIKLEVHVFDWDYGNHHDVIGKVVIDIPLVGGVLATRNRNVPTIRDYVVLPSSLQEGDALLQMQGMRAGDVATTEKFGGSLGSIKIGYAVVELGQILPLLDVAVHAEAHSSKVSEQWELRAEKAEAMHAEAMHAVEAQLDASRRAERLAKEKLEEHFERSHKRRMRGNDSGRRSTTGSGSGSSNDDDDAERWQVETEEEEDDDDDDDRASRQRANNGRSTLWNFDDGNSSTTSGSSSSSNSSRGRGRARGRQGKKPSSSQRQRQWDDHENNSTMHSRSMRGNFAGHSQILTLMTGIMAGILASGMATMLVSARARNKKS